MATNTNQRLYLAGIALIALGSLSLLGNVGVLGGAENLMGALILGGGGAFLVRLYRQQPRRLWALFVGFALLGAAVAAIVSSALAGSAFLGTLGLGFFMAYRTKNKHWWALIPAGVLWTLALVAGLGEFLPAIDEGPVFFFGLAATFGVLYRLPNRGQAWAIYPAIGAAVLAIVSGSFSGGWVLPALLIGAGVYLFNQKAYKAEQVKGADTTSPSSNLEDDAPPSVQPAWKEVIADLEHPQAKKPAEKEEGPTQPTLV